MRAVKGFIKRRIADEIVLVPVDEMAGRLKGVVLLNESAGVLWDLLGHDCTREGLVHGLMLHYEDVDEATAQDAVDSFLDEMNRYQLIDA